MAEQAVGSAALWARAKIALSLTLCLLEFWDTLGWVLLSRVQPQRLKEGEAERNVHHFGEAPWICWVPQRGYSLSP